MSGVGSSRQKNVELMLDWISALRRGDLEAIAELLDPGVTWQGLSGDLVCIGRADVMAVVREQVPVTFEVEAIELISAPGQVVMGTRSGHLPEPPGMQLKGQVYNVFERRDRRFSAIRDFARRDEALAWAGAARQAQWA